MDCSDTGQHQILIDSLVSASGQVRRRTAAQVNDRQVAQLVLADNERSERLDEAAAGARNADQVFGGRRGVDREVGAAVGEEIARLRAGIEPPR